MKSYIALLRARFLTLLQYRKAAVAGACTQIFWAVIFSIILTAFYRANPAASPLSLETILIFNWINQGLWLLIPWNIDKEIERQIRSGTVAYELIRPLNLYWLYFFRALALRLVPLFIRSVPFFIIAVLFFGLPAPHACLAFVASICCSLLLSAAITTLLMISLFWTISGEGILRVIPQVAIFFSGLVVPIPLFPDWAQTFMQIQPFRGILDIPCRIYTGLIPVSDSYFYLGFQLAWALVLILCGHIIIKRALHKIQIQGG